MGNFLKKNWFVVLVICAFAGISIFYIYDTNKGKLAGKSVNGEDVVYTIGETDVTANAYYDDLYETGGTAAMTYLFEKAVADSVETTNEIKDNAKAQADNVISNFKSQYGSSYQTNLNNALARSGYTDLEEYLIKTLKINQISADYAKANHDDLKIREISYILIKKDEAETSEDGETEEKKEESSDEASENETARMKEVDDALASGKDFGEVAAEFTDDEKAAANNGRLGVIDKNTTSLDAAFLEAALALEEGEVSQWIYSETFGYFKIKCTAATPETLAANNPDSDPYLELIGSYDTTLSSKAIWSKAEELGIDFKGNEKIEKALKYSYGVEGSDSKSDDAEETASPEAEATAEPTADAEKDGE